MLCWCCGKAGHVAAVCTWKRKRGNVRASERSVGYGRTRYSRYSRSQRSGRHGRQHGSVNQGGIFWLGECQEERKRDENNSRQGDNRRVLADVVKARRLITMGFQPVRVMNTLVAVGNDENRAIDKLLTERVAGEWQKMTGTAGIAVANVVVGMADSMVVCNRVAYFG